MSDTAAGEKVRLRLYVEGVVVDEEWAVEDERARATAERQIDLSMKADEFGLGWVAETFDPAAPADRAYMRWGTDTNRIINGSPLGDRKFSLVMAEHPYMQWVQAQIR